MGSNFEKMLENERINGLVELFKQQELDMKDLSGILGH